MTSGARPLIRAAAPGVSGGQVGGILGALARDANGVAKVGRRRFYDVVGSDC